MPGEDILENSPPPAADPAERPSKKKGILFWLHGATFFLGMGLLAFLIYRIGYQNILESIGKVGWGFLAIFALNFTRHLLRAASLYIAVDPAQRNFKYTAAAAARLGGEAVTFFSFTGPFLGDATKAMLLKKNIPLKYGASAIIIDNIAYYSSVIMMILAGVAVLIDIYGTGSRTMTRVLFGIVVGSVLMFAFIVGSIWLQVRPFTMAVDILAKRITLPGFISKRRGTLEQIESNVFDFYNKRRMALLAIFGLIWLTHALSVTEVFLILRFLDLPGGVATSFIIESLTKVINAVFIWFIPGTVGVYEGGNGVILRLVGVADATAVGLGLALVRRGASLMSIFIGAVILLWRGAARGAKHFAKDDEAPS